jgi:ABC-type transport system involved in multi-copper enzyme maturation permease subunit
VTYRCSEASPLDGQVEVGMDSPTALWMTRWMVALTFREALASRLFWVTSLVTAICVLLCLSVRVVGPAPLPVEPGEARLRLPLEDYQRRPDARAQGIDPAASEVSILFGAVRIQYRHYSDDAVRFLESFLGGLVANVAGVVLLLLGTAGFLPDFLEPANASVLLSKPVPRWSLLVGKYLGVVGFVGLQTFVFVVGTWLALGVSTGVWVPNYLLCWPVLLLHFAVFFSLSVCLAVWSRRAVVCMVGVLAFWIACWAVNHAWHAWQGAGPAAPLLLDVAYWVLPKPADLNWMLFDLHGARDHFGTLFDYRALAGLDGSPLFLSVLSSLAFPVVVLLLGAIRFTRTDY